MTKIVLSVLALAALSTASFADRNREDFRTSNGGVTIESAGLVVYGGSQGYMGGFEGNQNGR